jgi:hypothetical protein
MNRGEARRVLVALMCGLGALMLAAAILGGVEVDEAGAAQTRPFTGVSFGPDGVSGSEDFVTPTALTVDQSNGDVFVLDATTQRIYKFDSAGEPMDFTSTGTNWISVEIQVGELVEIAVAPPGAPGGTGGDIYVAEGKNLPSPAPPSVTVFASSGKQLAGFGPPVETSSCGVATDSAGSVLVMVTNRVREFVPTANPPVETDLVQASGPLGIGFCSVAAGAPGDIYVSEINSPTEQALYRLDGTGDPKPTKISATGATALAVNAQTGTLFADEEVGEITEYAAGGATKLGVFGGGQLSGSRGVAVYPSTDQVYATDRGSGRVKVFGPPQRVPAVTLGVPTFIDPSRVILPGSVDPEGIPVTECRFEYGLTPAYGQEAACASIPSGSGAEPVAAEVTHLETDGVTYHFRLVATNENGPNNSPDQTFVTPTTVDTESASAVTETSARLNGRVFPNGLQYTECEFEYGPVSVEGFQSAKECNPTAGELPPDSSFHAVTADVTNLGRNNVSYRYRLRVKDSNGKVVVGKTLKFTTSGEPQISEVRAFDADQDSARLQAWIDPRGFSTSYRIEWGATRSYGQIAVAGVIDPNRGPTAIEAKIDGLSPNITYHFRVVVSSAAGEVASLDRQVEALNGCGFLQQRCLELVSPRDPGPIASPGHFAELLNFDEAFRAGDRPGALAYVSEGGYPGATRGAEVLYKGIRSEKGWSTTQVSAPVNVLDETQGEHSNSSRSLALSSELSCGVTETNQVVPGMTAAMRQVVEVGGENLYRMDGDGSYTPITTSPPENIEIPVPNGSVYFSTFGMSQECGRIYFSSAYRYPGTQGVPNPRETSGAYLYEWSQVAGVRAVGFVPGPGGVEVPVAAEPGNTKPSERAERNAVAADGSQIFFTAERAVGTNPGEVGLGVKGLFVRRGEVTMDVSRSETSVPDTKPEYQWATPDGQKVFFTAPAGLTAESSAEGVDLYEYDLTKAPSEHPLTDLSVNMVESSADVAGVVGGSKDGSRLYFAASGRMVAGRGLSAAENLDADSLSLYVLDGGGVRFIATVGGGNDTGKLLVSASASATSQVTPEGRYLLFESTTQVTSYSSDGVPEVYLFDADAPSEAISCLSCRSDGKPAVRPAGNFTSLLSATSANATDPVTAPRTLTLVNGAPTVTFASVDQLSSDAVEGRVGLYEWSDGQISLLSAESGAFSGSNGQGEEDLPGFHPVVKVMGASADGSDFYFSTPTPQNWENTTAPYFVYDARIGGGFQQPPPPPAPCQPGSEGSCQASPSSPPGGTSPGSSGFVGPGNAKPKKCKKRLVRKKNKCVKKKAKHHKKNAKGKTAHGKKQHKKKNAKGKRGAGK